MRPNLVIIGGMKCGTTSLHHYLGLHPQIAMSRPKELNFFIGERNWPRGIGWYEAQFAGRAAQVYGEASPDYSRHPTFEGVPARMASVLPNTKLIYMVRDPVQRLISHYVHDYAAGDENRPIDRALAGFADNPYVWPSRYYSQLRLYLDHFPPANVLVAAAEDLHRRRPETLSRIFQFLGVDETFYSPSYAHTRHHSKDKRRKTPAGETVARWPVMRPLFTLLKRLPASVEWHIERALFWPLSRLVLRPRLDAALARDLRAFLRDETEQLRHFTGQPFADWAG